MIRWLVNNKPTSSCWKWATPWNTSLRMVGVPITIRTGQVTNADQGRHSLNKAARSVVSIILWTHELWTILLHCSCAERTGMTTKRIQIRRMIKFWNRVALGTKWRYLHSWGKSLCNWTDGVGLIIWPPRSPDITSLELLIAGVIYNGCYLRPITTRNSVRPYCEYINCWRYR